MKILPLAKFAFSTYNLSHKEVRFREVEQEFEETEIHFVPTEVLDDETGEMKTIEQEQEVAVIKPRMVTEEYEVEVFLDKVIDITDEEYEGLIQRTHCFSDDLKSVVRHEPSAEEMELEDINKRAMECRQTIDNNKQWFDWYDNQTSQALRAVRTETEWTATRDGMIYFSLADLDIEANRRQVESKAMMNEIESFEGKRAKLYEAMQAAKGELT